MKSCEIYELLASMAVDGEATGEEQAELAAHLEACPACRTYLEDIRRIHASFLREEADLPEDFAVRVMDRVRETRQDRPGEKKEKTAVRSPRWRRWAALAACCAVVVSCAWFLRGGDAGGDAMVLAGQDPAGDVRTRAADAADQAAQYSDGDETAASGGVPDETDQDNAVPDEVPPPVPEEYAALAESAVRDGAGEGGYQPLGQSEAPVTAAASPQPEPVLDDGANGASPAPVTVDLDGAEPDGDEEAKEADKTENETEDEGNEPPDGAEEPAGVPAEDPDLPEEPESQEEPSGPEDAVEPAEVIGVPESGVLIAYGSAAQNWVENTLGLEWAVGGSYPLTAEQYSDLLQTLEEAGELYSIAPGEGYCLMTE